MKCQIQWIDSSGNRTPDENEAVMMAHIHKSNITTKGSGFSMHMEYLPEIADSFPICAQHYARVIPTMRYALGGGWEFTPIPEQEKEADSEHV